MAFDSTHSHNPNQNWIEREAVLFQAGDYPDKGVNIQPEDLRQLADNFKNPVPVLIEHADSPLELGFLHRVRAEGDHLYGTVRLSREADSLVRKSGAQSLSLGISADLRNIVEVSLVRNPRVPGAKLFSGPCFEVPWHASEPEVGSTLETFVRQGKLTPAQKPFAEALMAIPGVIEFDGSKENIRALLIAMIERQPPHLLFQDVAPSTPEGQDALLMPEEEAFYRRYFPDVKLADIASRK